MSSIRTKLGIAGALAAFAVGSEPVAAAIAIEEQDENTSEAAVVADAPPSQVYATATDYQHWPRWFSDVRSVKIESGGRDNARVRFSSRALGGRTFTVQFENLPGQAIRFRGVKGPPGARAYGEYRFESIDGGKRTRLSARIYMNVSGVSSLFVSDSTVRAMRQAKLRADLTDAQRWGVPPPPAQSASARTP